jgi:hypothetical protein
MKCQGTTSEAADKLPRSLKKRQGTTSVVPQKQQNKCRALAPASFCFQSLVRDFAAAKAKSDWTICYPTEVVPFVARNQHATYLDLGVRMRNSPLACMKLIK